MNSKILEVAFDHSLQGIIAFDDSGEKCLKINKAAKQMLEIDEVEYLSKNLSMSNLVISKNSGTEKTPITLNQLKNNGRFYEAIICKPNKSLLYVDLLCHYESEIPEPIFILMFRDIFHQLKLQREVKNKQEQIQVAYNDILEQYNKLKELDDMKNRFVALTSHELKTPLSAMMATTEILHKNFYDTKEEHDEFIKILYEQSLHLWEIVKDVLDFSKIQSGKFDFYIEQNSIVPLTKSIVLEFDEMAKKKNLKFNFITPADLQDCFFDEVRMKQIISNVLSNAIKFTHPSTAIDIKIWQDDSFVYLSIMDHGPGIKPEDLQRIFNEFETVTQIKNHHHGTGLGLPISKRLIELQGGQINVRSEVNSFSEFQISIPKLKILSSELYRSRANNSDDWIQG